MEHTKVFSVKEYTLLNKNGKKLLSFIDSSIILKKKRVVKGKYMHIISVKMFKKMLVME